MASTSWLSLAGVEVANSARTNAYAAAGLKPRTLRLHDCGCDGLAGMLGDPAYTTPELDVVSPPAWVDPAEPDSLQFAGLLITDIKGLDAAPVDRVVTQRLGDGAVIGRRRYGARTITVTGVLVAGSCCGLEYGQRWLNSVLAGSLGCGPGSCGGDDLCFFTCCPPECASEECATGYYRTLRDVVLTQEPQTLSEFGTGCGCGASGCGGPCPAREVSFQLTAGKPHALRQPITITSDATWDPGAAPTECLEWSNDPDCVDEAEACALQEAAPCPLDPACPPPTLPELPLPTNPCQCDPINGRVRLCIDIPEATAPIWADAVPILRVYAGLTDLRSVRIRFYPNPLGRPVDQLDPCGFCSELNVSYIPANGTLTLDGTRKRATVTCPGRAETPAGSILAGPQGGPLIWPELECGIAYVACVEVDAATINPQARVSLDTVVREV